jgi:3-dehydroquinate synthase
MLKKSIKFNATTVDYYFNAKLAVLSKIVDRVNTILVTDENVFSLHQNKFKNWNTIVLKPGETFKVQATVDSVIQQLIELNADRTTTLVGVGGGVVTDITGYVASVYMRGIRLGFVPTTILALVDASIGGKNGVDAGVYKNMIGVIRQPAFILQDLSFLKTLPHPEWKNGFAEIIKHACIKDASMFKQLESADLNYYQKKPSELSELIKNNALLKTKIVQKDEMETGERKFLNFGHTLGHAIENLYSIPHGEAISIGMAYASRISEKELKLKDATKIINLVKQYELPTEFKFDKEKVFSILKMDKKKVKDSIDYILLNKIGSAVIQRFSFNQLKSYF